MKKYNVNMFNCMLLYSSVLLFTGCPDNGVEPPTKPSFSLSAEEVVSTEALIKIHYASSESINVQLKRNGQTIASNLPMYKEFLFNDTPLQPQQNYTYKAYKIENGKAVDSTSSLHITTMDTTSHDWKWTVENFGISSSYLYDIAIINDTLAYAVGEIYIMDSTGKYDPNAYNLIKWDGKKWTLLRTLVRDFGSGTGFYPIYTVFGFGTNDVWFASDADLIHWDGIKFTSKAFFMTSIPFTGQVKKMWGTSGNNLYCVGRGGAIFHYNGTTWQKIESGTTVPLNDVWGGSNKWLGENIVLIAASEKYYAGEKKLLRIRNGKDVDSLTWTMQDRRIHSVWFNQTSPIFTTGAGTFQSTIYGTWKDIYRPFIYTNRIRGNASNDLITVGDFGIAAHYNGVMWKVYDEIGLPNGNYESVSIKGNLAIAVGWYGQSAKSVIAVGKR